MDNHTLPIMLEADLQGKVVLVRMDHNVVKKGIVKDTMRVDATIPTLLHIYKKGGLPVIMTHVGRPYDKKTGILTISEDESVQPIIDYLHHKLQLKILIPRYENIPSEGITDFQPIKEAITKLKNGEADLVYLPNSRWFKGEETKDTVSDELAKQFSAIADVFINDAFGSWQPHVSTVGPTKYLPSYAGLLMQKEIEHLTMLFNPEKPLLSIVAGAKFDTKIGPLSALIKMSDYLILGGVLYNTYLCVKYGISIKGVTADDLELARKFISEAGADIGKIVEMPYIIESDSFDEVKEGSWRVHSIKELKKGMQLNYVLDVSAESFSESGIQAVLSNARTIFINAVMGYTTLFQEGTKAMYKLIDGNAQAMKLYGGGDTIQEFKDLLPTTFSKAMNNQSYYFFTGGGAILDAIEQGSPLGMKPVQALMDNSLRIL